MNKKLAIKGHPTRGEEVIELLKMMGGKNNCDSPADNLGLCYLIDDEFDICAHYFGYDDYEDGELNIFTLEEFLEKYPFKVGDKVFDKVDGYPGTITAMKWHEDISDMKYRVAFYNGDMSCWYTNDRIESLKLEEEKAIDLAEKYYEGQCDEMNKTQTKENDVRKTGYTLNELIDLVPLTSDSVMIAVREEFEIIEEQGKFFLKKKKSTYPTTYAECCEVIANSKPYAMNKHYTDVNKLLQTFQTLFICRNAYWKIAGEEMGLDKPWEPDYTDLNNITYYGLYNELRYSIINPAQFIFPTIEMRDAFYKNFKDLIENCK